jgi:hypothetical protein
MLEQGYWIAGIVAAAAAVLGLWRVFKRKNSTEITQTASVSGEGNSLNQSSEIRTGEDKNN